VSADPHSPTTAGPTPEPVPEPLGGSLGPPSGDSGAASSAVTDRPEVQVGAAFAGGLLAALILKRLGH